VSKKLTIAAGIALVALTAASGTAEARTQIRIVGSSTVYPFTTAVAEQFARANPRFKAPIVESTGTGGGIKLFCSGVGPSTPDAVNASRRIKASEVKQCAENGVDKIIEIQVGLDGIVIAHAKNAADFNATSAQIYRAVAATPFGKPQKARTWKDISPAFPADRIEVLGPPPTSGTRDAFNELILEAGCKTPAMDAMKKSDDKRHKTICTKVREDGAYVESGENDNLIVQKLVANPKAVGIFGYSFLEENLDKLKPVNLNGVEPTYANISSFKYPASRPLYIYVKAAHVRAIPGLREFLAEYSKESTWGARGYLAQRGLIASPDAARQKYAAAARMLTPLDPNDVK
jgi:phosphate transport system substrate-binding protein